MKSFCFIASHQSTCFLSAVHSHIRALESKVIHSQHHLVIQLMSHIFPQPCSPCILRAHLDLTVWPCCRPGPGRKSSHADPGPALAVPVDRPKRTTVRAPSSRGGSSRNPTPWFDMLNCMILCPPLKKRMLSSKC